MLQPKRTKFRKQHKSRNRGLAQNGNKVSFGEYGLKAVDRGRLTARQIEAARRAMTRHIKRGGKIWIRIFPDTPVTKKPIEVRMGKGKGNVEYWVAKISPGKMLYEMEGVSEEIAREAFSLAAAKLPIRNIFCCEDHSLMNATDLRQKETTDLEKELDALLKEQFNLRMQRGSGQIVKPHDFKRVRRDIARIRTVITEKPERSLMNDATDTTTEAAAAQKKQAHCYRQSGSVTK